MIMYTILSSNNTDFDISQILTSSSNELHLQNFAFINDVVINHKFF